MILFAQLWLAYMPVFIPCEPGTQGAIPKTMKTTPTTSYRINDHVTGTYHDVKFAGVIDSGDYSGGIGVKLDPPIVVYKIERDRLYISDRTCIETVERGEE